MKVPNISLLFASTTKGHFGRTNIWDLTLKDWQENGFLDNFSYKIAHVKSDNPELAGKMGNKFSDYGFNHAIITPGSFKHFDPSHSIGQIQDIGTLIENISTRYILFLEDDWLVRPKTNNLNFHLSAAINLLDSDIFVSQVRIPRHSDDSGHYKTLKKDENGWFRQNDIFSFNPYIARTDLVRKIYNSAAVQSDLIIDLINRGQLNSELTFTEYAKQINGPNSFYSFDSRAIQCFHIGTKEGEEDKIIN